MSEWIWLSTELVLATHAEQLARFGGPPGVRDRGALESALARPLNLVAYGEPDAAQLAAACAFGLARNHAFVDGNKRIAWLAARIFLRLNAFPLRFETQDSIDMMLGLAAGNLSEEDVATWFRERLVETG